MYSQKFLNAQSKVNKLQLKFENNPCKKTASPLAQARVELEKVSCREQKYTAEFLAQETKLLVEDIKDCVLKF